MNLLINFIEPQEVRSASMVSAKSMLQIFAVLVPAILVLMIFLAYIGYAEKKSALELHEGTWAKTEVRLNRANELNQSLQARKQAFGELAGWQQARMIWHEALDGIRASVPESVQIKVLQARQSLEVGEDGHARRVLRMIMSGRCEGPEAEATVERFRAALESE
jgi:Tfp pilus assembly protein PilN